MDTGLAAPRVRKVTENLTQTGSQTLLNGPRTPVLAAFGILACLQHLLFKKGRFCAANGFKVVTPATSGRRFQLIEVTRVGQPRRPAAGPASRGRTGYSRSHLYSWSLEVTRVAPPAGGGGGGEEYNALGTLATQILGG